MMQKKTIKWGLDFFLLALFLLAFYVSLTGLSNHQWIGLGFGALSIIHLTLNWTWVRSAIKRLFVRSAGKTRIFAGVDGLLWVGSLTILVTGIAMATWFNFPLPDYTTWRTVHIAASAATLSVLIVKLGLHWRWITSGVKAIWRSRPAAAAVSTPAEVKQVNRREFLALALVAGPMTGITLLRSLDTLLVLMHIKKSKSTHCTYGHHCPRSCHFPGQCSRYVDQNNNKNCDLGECL